METALRDDQTYSRLNPTTEDEGIGRVVLRYVDGLWRDLPLIRAFACRLYGCYIIHPEIGLISRAAWEEQLPVIESIPQIYGSHATDSSVHFPLREICCEATPVPPRIEGRCGCHRKPGDKQILFISKRLIYPSAQRFQIPSMHTDRNR